MLSPMLQRNSTCGAAGAQAEEAAPFCTPWSPPRRRLCPRGRDSPEQQQEVLLHDRKTGHLAKVSWRKRPNVRTGSWETRPTTAWSQAWETVRTSAPSSSTRPVSAS